MDTLPCEIILEISNYIDLKTIFCVKKANKKLYCNVKSIENYILLRQLRYSPIRDMSVINGFMFYLRVTAIWNSYVDVILVKLYDMIYVYRRYSQIDLFMFYHIFRLTRPYTNSEYIDISLLFSSEYYVNFLYTMSKEGTSHSLDFACYNYYKFLLEKNAMLSFDSMYKMSCRVINMEVLKKLFACKVLSLSNTVMVPCCDNCIRPILSRIVYIKYNSYTDNLIDHNYREIKAFFARTNPFLYKTLLRQETICIKQNIVVKHPITKQLIRVQSRRGRRMIDQFAQTFPYSKHYHEIRRNINAKERQMRSVHFN